MRPKLFIVPQFESCAFFEQFRSTIGTFNLSKFNKFNFNKLKLILITKSKIQFNYVNQLFTQKD